MWRRRVEWLQLEWMYVGCGREGRGIGRRRRTVAIGEDVVSDSDIADSPALPTTTATTAIATTWLTPWTWYHPSTSTSTNVGLLHLCHSSPFEECGEATCIFVSPHHQHVSSSISLIAPILPKREAPFC